MRCRHIQRLYHSNRLSPINSSFRYVHHTVEPKLTKTTIESSDQLINQCKGRMPKDKSNSRTISQSSVQKIDPDLLHVIMTQKLTIPSVHHPTDRSTNRPLKQIISQPPRAIKSALEFFRGVDQIAVTKTWNYVLASLINQSINQSIYRSHEEIIYRFDEPSNQSGDLSTTETNQWFDPQAELHKVWQRWHHLIDQSLSQITVKPVRRALKELIAVPDSETMLILLASPRNNRTIIPYVVASMRADTSISNPIDISTDQSINQPAYRSLNLSREEMQGLPEDIYADIIRQRINQYTNPFYTPPITACDAVVLMNTIDQPISQSLHAVLVNQLINQSDYHSLIHLLRQYHVSINSTAFGVQQLIASLIDSDPSINQSTSESIHHSERTEPILPPVTRSDLQQLMDEVLIKTWDKWLRKHQSISQSTNESTNRALLPLSGWLLCFLRACERRMQQSENQSIHGQSGYVHNANRMLQLIDRICSVDCSLTDQLIDVIKQCVKQLNEISNNQSINQSTKQSVQHSLTGLDGYVKRKMLDNRNPNIEWNNPQFPSTD